ncbi:hypothetical protein K373_05942 [Streptomyces sp. DvalAA-21]|nr:hypothetical protein SACTE_2230 [Streptomyces sp. SirexAA-E]PZX31778.1 hypothetical protein K373_05942 [Streptomyces sp. DvalAA-21]RAJ28416.1 hypothetical protein K351_05670 [Streptomyces sp. DpondAA-E10]RAJ42048.1 hypothetical protein K352_05661 [Streptomyces sp. DpondAA-A50]SCE17211.1 hypothetical protein GA0115239_12725 [Streptomyces sp. BpilaLS-43]SCE17617.1 hypothetical protein GA0115235_11305 [Streptomyces sp. DpondAA-F4a]SCM00824.1 hypothetical protein SAMN04883147_1052174 [Streptom
MAEQEAPGPEAEDGGDPGDVEECPGAAPVERGQGLRVPVPALEEQGQAEQGQDGDGRDPHHEVEGVRGRRLAGEDVGHTPAGRRRDDQDEGEDGPARPLVDGGHPDAGERHTHPHDPRAAGPFAERQGREQRGEDGLHLEDEGGQPGGHPPVHPDEQQPELGDAEGQSHAEDPLPGHLRPSHEEHGGQCGDEEAQGGEEQRREVGEADLDDDEVDAPEGGDERGQGDVEGTHAPRIRGADRVAPARIRSWLD